MTIKSLAIVSVALSGLAGCMNYPSIGDKALQPASVSVVATSEDFAAANALLSNAPQRELAGVLMIRESDRICHEYLNKLSMREKTVRSGLSISALLLTAAAGVTTPEESKNILTALSTGAQGVENSLDDVVLGGVDADLLVQANRKGRKRQRVELAKILLANGGTNTGFMLFMTEFETYHDSCGISYGRDVLKTAIADSPEDDTPSATEINAQEAFTG